MQPVLILQHLSGDGPAYLSAWLQRQGIPFEVRNGQAGELFPPSMDGFAGLAILGGEMSANDPLPSLRQAERLILESMDRGLPVLGHCLGGQLMARALGAGVGPSPAPEIGWSTIEVADDPLATAWFGDQRQPTVFQWHFEAFDLPSGARLLASSPACPYQAFTIADRHLAMQFHVEVDAEKVDRWSHERSERHDAVLTRASVQQGPAMRAGIAPYLAAQQRLADRLYGRWASSVHSI
jgi:GMP synthase (glutamine-hydrolysing)